MDVGGDSSGNRGSPMKIERFEMERYQSTWENTVEFNLADSGVHPITLAALVDHSWIREVLAREQLGYGHTNGSEELRTTIAGLYHAAGPEHVLVTSGTAEANFLITWALLEPGDHTVVMLPNYMQIPGLARAWGAEAVSSWLREPAEWTPDLEELERLVTPKTKAIFVCNPNNPTGAVFSVDGLSGLVSWIAPRAGAIAFLRYQPRVNPTELATRLRKAHDVLVVPGDHFQLDGHIRIGYGGDKRLLEEGLRRIAEFLRTV